MSEYLNTTFPSGGFFAGCDNPSAVPVLASLLALLGLSVCSTMATILFTVSRAKREHKNLEVAEDENARIFNRELQLRFRARRLTSINEIGFTINGDGGRMDDPAPMSNDIASFYLTSPEPTSPGEEAPSGVRSASDAPRVSWGIAHILASVNEEPCDDLHLAEEGRAGSLPGGDRPRYNSSPGYSSLQVPDSLYRTASQERVDQLHHYIFSDKHVDDFDRSKSSSNIFDPYYRGSQGFSRNRSYEYGSGKRSSSTDTNRGDVSPTAFPSDSRKSSHNASVSSQRSFLMSPFSKRRDTRSGSSSSAKDKVSGSRRESQVSVPENIPEETASVISDIAPIPAKAATAGAKPVRKRKTSQQFRDAQAVFEALELQNQLKVAPPKQEGPTPSRRPSPAPCSHAGTAKRKANSYLTTKRPSRGSSKCPSPSHSISRAPSPIFNKSVPRNNDVLVYKVRRRSGLAADQEQASDGKTAPRRK